MRHVSADRRQKQVKDNSKNHGTSNIHAIHKTLKSHGHRKMSIHNKDMSSKDLSRFVDILNSFVLKNERKKHSMFKRDSSR